MATTLRFFLWHIVLDVSEHLRMFDGSTFCLPLVSGLAPGSSGLSLLLENLQTGCLGLLLVDKLHQDSLVLENVSLRLQVKGVVPGIAVRLTLHLNKEL